MEEVEMFDVEAGSFTYVCGYNKRLNRFAYVLKDAVMLYGS